MLLNTSYLLNYLVQTILFVHTNTHWTDCCTCATHLSVKLVPEITYDVSGGTLVCSLCLMQSRVSAVQGLPRSVEWQQHVVDEHSPSQTTKPAVRLMKCMTYRYPCAVVSPSNRCAVTCRSCLATTVNTSPVNCDVSSTASVAVVNQTPTTSRLSVQRDVTWPFYRRHAQLIA